MENRRAHVTPRIGVVLYDNLRLLQSPEVLSEGTGNPRYVEKSLMWTVLPSWPAWSNEKQCRRMGIENSWCQLQESQDMDSSKVKSMVITQDSTCKDLVWTSGLLSLWNACIPATCNSH